MQIDRRLVGFGLFLITVGTVMVAVRQGVLSDETAGRAWSLWPLILVGIGLSIEANAGDGRLTLAGARLARLSIQRNAGSVDIDLREVAALDELTVDINAGSGTLRLPAVSLDGGPSVNAGSIAICSAPGTGLWIRLDGSFAAANDVDEHGVTQVGGAWETTGYATAEVRIALRAEVNAGSLSLDPVRTCAG